MIYPDAIWRPGPGWKTNAGPNACYGVVCHSAVGYRYGLHSVLDGPKRASWHFSVFYDGTIEQHYDTAVQTWHGQASNAYAIGIEHEGGYDPVDEPLTPPQLAASIKLVRWLSQQHGFPLERHNGLWEHNEFANKPCPSNRIPWDKYTEELMFTDGEAAELRGLIEWRYAVVPVIDALLNDQKLDDAAIADIKAKLQAISNAAGGK